jgi:hypothetical protein
MTKRRLLVIGSLVVWLCLLAIIVFVSLNLLSTASWGNPIGDQLSPKIAGDTQVGQGFTALYPGLYAVDVMLVRDAAAGPQPITFHLKTWLASPEDLWTAEFDGNTISPDRPTRFEFPPRPDSQGRPFYFFLESTASQPGSGMAVRYGLNVELERGTAYLNGQPIGGSLQFQTHYALRTRETVYLLLSRMSEGRPSLLGIKGFYLVLAGVYALSLAVFVLQIARIVLEEPET